MSFLPSKTLIIAEIGSNHDGDLERAKELIYLAKDAGADCAKFQHFLAKDIVSDFGFRNLGAQQSHQFSWDKSVFEIYDQYHCPRDWTDLLVETCNAADIDFMTTPYDFDAINLFSELVPAFKIGSGDITWLAAQEQMAKTGKPVLLACGASSMEDVTRAVNFIASINSKICLMQCNTNYTGDDGNYSYINLNVLKSFAETWPGMILGLSDHTNGNTTVLGAVALGARVIEKHFTDDNGREGPDHHFAMNPSIWREMVDRTRELEQALGDGIKRVEENESDTVVIQRRSIRVKSSIENGLKAGTVLTEDHLECLRPCPPESIPPYDMGKVLGKKLIRNIQAGEHLECNDLS